jgi:heat-inducible transcriptional repressor
MSKSKINDRAIKVLTDIVERYIRNGEPIGSKVLSQESDLMLSSASIRHIMADLEAAGFLKSPHTSAGRIPTEQGYRVFVDQIMTIQEPAHVELQALQAQLDAHADEKELVEQASSLLSGITELAGIVTLPKRDQLILKQVEFLPLSKNRVLVILVINESEVQNRVINTDREYSASELEQAGNYLTHHYANKDLRAVRDLLIKELQQNRQNLDEMITTVMDLATQTVDKKQDYVIAGEVNLFESVQPTNYQKLRQLFEAFSEKRDILYLLDQSIQAQGIQLFIGEESGHDVLQDYSMVTAPYQADGKVVGVLGVIGPTRMPYSKIISTVDATAKILSKLLSK